MALGINIRETQGIAVLELNGRLVLGQECDTLRNHVKQLLASNKKKIVLNLRKVNYSDSVGLGCLAAAFTSIRNQDGELKLIEPSKRVQEVLDLTRLNTIFEVYATEEDALASFKQLKDG